VEGGRRGPMALGGAGTDGDLEADASRSGAGFIGSWSVFSV